MKKFYKILLITIVGLFIASTATAYFGLYWKTIKDFDPRTDNDVEIGKDDKRVKKIWTYGLDASSTISGKDIVVTGDITANNVIVNGTLSGDYSYNSVQGGYIYDVFVRQLRPITGADIRVKSANFVPYGEGYDLGKSGQRWEDLWLSSTLTDGTDSITVANIVAKADYSFGANNFSGTGDLTTTGTGTFGDLVIDTDAFLIDPTKNRNIGIHSPAHKDKVVKILMDSDDVWGIFIDGETNPYTGNLLTHAFRSKRYWDYATSTIPQSMIANFYVARHASSDAIVDASRELTVTEMDLEMTGNIKNEGAADLNFYAFPFFLNITNSGTYDSTGAGYMKIQNRGDYIHIVDTSTWTDTSGTGNVNGVANSGGYFWIDSAPTLNSGDAVFANFGVRVLVEGTTTGWSSNYGVYIDKVLGADTNWALYDNTTANSCLHALRVGSEVAPTVALDVTGQASISDIIHLTPKTTAPASCTEGDIYADDSGCLCYCETTDTWTSLGGGGTCE